jgi:hypothetical protein
LLERSEGQRARSYTDESILAKRPSQRHGKLLIVLRDPLCNEQADRVVANATGRETQNLGRRLIEPLDVVDCGEHRAVAGQDAKRAKESGRDGSRLGRRP